MLVDDLHYMYSWTYQNNVFHIVGKDMDGYLQKYTIIYSNEEVTINSKNLSFSWDYFYLRSFPGGFMIDSPITNFYPYYFNNGTRDHRFNSSFHCLDVFSPERMRFYRIYRPNCNHGGSGTMSIYEYDRNRTLLRSERWIRFLAKGFETYGICHDVQLKMWNIFPNGSFILPIQANYIGGCSLILLKIDEDLEMVDFKVALPLQTIRIDEMFEDLTTGIPTTGDNYTFRIGSLKTDLITRNVIVELQYGNGRFTQRQLFGYTSMEAEIPIPSDYSGYFTYRYHFTDFHDFEYFSEWKDGFIVDNDPPTISMMEVDPSIPSCSKFKAEMNASDNVGLSSITVHYRFGDGQIVHEELLMPGEHKDPIHASKAENVNLEWKLYIPSDERGPLEFLIEVRDTAGWMVRSENFSIEVLDTIPPTIFFSENITVYANTTFEHYILAMDNWMINQYHWSVSSLHISENVISGSISKPGNYFVYVMVIDISMNWADASFWIIVLPEDEAPLPLLTGININDDTTRTADHHSSPEGSDFRPTYWGEPVPEEGEQEEEVKEENALEEEMMMAIFACSFVFIISLIVMMFAITKKIQQEDLGREE
jgi:hypothetical protein